VISNECVIIRDTNLKSSSFMIHSQTSNLNSRRSVSPRCFSAVLIEHAGISPNVGNYWQMSLNTENPLAFARKSLAANAHMH
jgi:hypothetical protein